MDSGGSACWKFGFLSICVSHDAPLIKHGAFPSRDRIVYIEHMAITKALLTIPLIVTIFVALVRATVHFELDWPVHAQHHLVHQIVLMVGISALGLMLLYGPLARLEFWAWWGMIAVGVSIHGGYWLGHPLVGLGEPGAIPNTAQVILSLLFAAGLATSWRRLWRPAES